jgi:hypothetical protein
LELVARFAQRLTFVLCSRLENWAKQIFDIVRDAWPEFPSGVEDRDADVWEPLLAVADAAGGNWPERARVAAVTLVTLLREANPSLGIRLLNDIRTVFGEAQLKATSTILAGLNEMVAAPWGDIGGKPLDDRGLARRLKKYGVESKVLRIGQSTVRGYTAHDLSDAWSRYLPPVPRTSVTSVTA